MRVYPRAVAISDPDPSALTLLDPDRWAAFLALAALRHRHPADLLDDAVDVFLEVDIRQRAEIEAGVREAEAGDFASADEVAAAFRPRGS